MFLKSSILCSLLAPLFCSYSHAGEISRKAVDFDRHYLINESLLEAVKQSGNLAASQNNTDHKVCGWFEYDFFVDATGWYVLTIEPGAGSHEVIVDGKETYITHNTPEIGNYWLEKGRHVLRLQRYHWMGFNAITDWRFTPAQEGIAHHLRVEFSKRLFRVGEEMEIAIQYGELKTAVTLQGTLIRHRVEGLAVNLTADDGTASIQLVPGEGLQQTTLRIPCTSEGAYKLQLQVGSQKISQPVVDSREIVVLDTTPQPRTGREASTQLIAEIDCATTEPDYHGGGDTKVVHKAFGAYRESSDTGWLRHMNSTDPSWFAYKVKVPQVQKQYMVELEYPDDQLRTFVFAVREGAVNDGNNYPTPGGADCGHEFRLSHAMQTQRIMHWAKTNELRILVIDAQDGMRAAASKIRIYAIPDGLPLLNVPERGGRSFGNWYEEGGSFLSVFGAPNQGPSGAAVAADRWARDLAYMGGDTLIYTMAIYQFGLYPSNYNLTYTGPFSDDQVGIILRRCEKYNLNFFGEFHPEARELDWPKAGYIAGENRAVNSAGQRKVMPIEPDFSPLHPRNRQWYLGLIGEFVDRYKDSPAFAGISLRLMEWYNPGLNNFHSLDWGYDDYTVGLFAQEQGIKLPVDSSDPHRAHKYHDWLKANAWQKWIDWRCQKITELHREIVHRLREARSDLQVFVYGDLTDLHGAGIDVQQLSKIDGLQLMTGMLYGRRYAPQDKNQEQRDKLLEPALMKKMCPNKPGTFTHSACYFEATEVVVPPVELGLPKDTQSGWMSGVVNPAGRNYLERWALSLAEADAIYLGDGGNSYTIGQPLLRNFLREYRVLPDAPFVSRADATDPVTIRERRFASDFLFYAVNRERYPVKVNLIFSGNGELRRLSTGSPVQLQGQQVHLELAPFQLLSFCADPSLQIDHVKVEIPQQEKTLVEKQVNAIIALAIDVKQGKTGNGLLPSQKRLLDESASEAQEQFHAGHYWRARTMLENSRLLPIYEATRRVPPMLRDDGAPLPPTGAMKAVELSEHLVEQGTAQIADSQKLCPNWGSDQLLWSTSGELKFKLSVPTDAWYRIEFSELSGDDWGVKDVLINGKPITVLEEHAGKAKPNRVLLETAPLLNTGEVELTLRAPSGKRLALGYLWLKPLMKDLVSSNWQAIGPFECDPDKNTEHRKPGFEETLDCPVYSPEQHRDFAASVTRPEGGKVRWQHLAGESDYVNLKDAFQKAYGTFGYAVTYIYSPQPRKCRLVYGMEYWAKMWMNGQVIQNFAEHGGAPFKGQFHVDTELKAGWNELLVKIVSGTLGNGFWMSVSDPGDLKVAPQPE